MTKLKQGIKLLAVLFIGGLFAVFFLNYPKLDIITGYSSKSNCSCTYIAGRPEAFTDSVDNNFSPVNLADDRVSRSEQAAYASLVGLKKRKARFFPELGCILMPPKQDELTFSERPLRSRSTTSLPFPYGTAEPRDTVFPEVNTVLLTETIENAFADNELQQTRAVLVVYKDRIIAEKYAPGFDKSSIHLGWSMTKSITATLYGILKHKNQFDIDQPAAIEEWQQDDRSKITYHHLLQMSSGLAWEEDYSRISDVTEMLFTATDMAGVASRKELIHAPGEHFYYSSGTTNLLSGLLKDEFPDLQSYLNFPYEALIDKIGMNSMIMETDASGTFVGSSYSWATARDWAKFGLLYLHKGYWNGEQIFSEDWADYVSTPASDSDGTYGAQFWLNASGVMPDAPRDTYYADGYQGQRVYIIPSKDLVIVRLGLTNGDYFDGNALAGGVSKAIQ